MTELDMHRYAREVGYYPGRRTNERGHVEPYVPQSRLLNFLLEQRAVDHAHELLGKKGGRREIDHDFLARRADEIDPDLYQRRAAFAQEIYDAVPSVIRDEFGDLHVKMQSSLDEGARLRKHGAFEEQRSLNATLQRMDELMLSEPIPREGVNGMEATMNGRRLLQQLNLDRELGRSDKCFPLQGMLDWRMGQALKNYAVTSPSPDALIPVGSGAPGRGWER